MLGYLHQLRKNLHDVREILIDQTGVGEVFVEEARKSGLKNARGLILTVQSKQEVMVFLKKLVEEKRLHLPFDRELMNEITAERFELMKSGLIQYSHPSNTHDDLFWALGLAVYSSRPDIPVYHFVMTSARSSRPVSGFNWLHPKASPKPPISGEWPCCIICGQYRRTVDPVCPRCHGNPDRSTWEAPVPNPWDGEAYVEFLENHRK